ncbi:MAG: type IV pilus assembly protein PilM [Solirubrobacterales bacterium]
MASASDAIWAIDLGNNSLKALRLAAVGEAVQVIGFDHVPHGKILSSSGISAAEKEELVAVSLRQFVQRNDVGYDPIILSVPSQNSFARFVTLPPVEAKRLPEIVRFEAAQQIPFDMSEVQWDFQLMSDPDSPEKKVGLFAIKNEVVNAAMEPLEREELSVSYVQMASMALYNYLLFDRPDLVSSDKRATVVINVGADTTDLVVCTASGVWQRCIMMGGNAFTNAIAETFKLNFEKAEKLKRTAPVSKYARQIFQAMRPVFTDWASEVQRSIGFYTSANPDVKLVRVVALGGGTKLRGLLKYLQQTLQIPVEKPDAFKRLAVSRRSRRPNSTNPSRTSASSTAWPSRAWAWPASRATCCPPPWPGRWPGRARCGTSTSRRSCFWPCRCCAWAAWAWTASAMPAVRTPGSRAIASSRRARR